MEKRKTLILFNTLIFIFLSTFMVSEKLNIAGTTLFNNQKEIIAMNDEIKVSNNEEGIINTTTTTVPSLQDSY